MIKVPKTKIKNLNFADSQNAYQSIQINDDRIDANYAYVIYKFKQMTGASSATYPFLYVFDGKG